MRLLSVHIAYSILTLDTINILRGHICKHKQWKQMGSGHETMFYNNFINLSPFAQIYNVENI